MSCQEVMKLADLELLIVLPVFPECERQAERERQEREDREYEEERRKREEERKRREEEAWEREQQALAELQGLTVSCRTSSGCW